MRPPRGSSSFGGAGGAGGFGGSLAEGAGAALPDGTGAVATALVAVFGAG